MVFGAHMYAWLMDLISRMAGRTAKANMEKDSESEEPVTNMGRIKYWFIQIIAYLGAIFFLIYFGLIAKNQFNEEPFLFSFVVIICVGAMVYVAVKYSDEEE